MEIKLYVAKDNPRHFIEVKHTDDRRYMYREYTYWEIADRRIYVGDSSAFIRCSKDELDKKLQDYIFLS